MSEAEKLLRDLIALPSVNPAFLPPGDPRAGEQRMGEFLANLCRRAGLEVRWQKALPGRSNLIASLRPTGAVKHRILLAPHLDTVNVVAKNQFSPIKKNDRLYGRGACDTKGSVAAMIAAVLQLARCGRRPSSTEIIFAGLIDEESGQSGSRAFADSGMKADLAIIGEPTQLKIVTAHKGNVWLRLETRGQAAHGSCPELGQNAVHEMARIVDWIETDYARTLAQRKHPLLGSATVNVGFMNGGTQPNIVPARCEAGIDRRTLPGETEKTVMREINAALRRKGLRARLTSEKSTFCLPMETDPKLPLVAQFLSVAKQNQPAGVKFFCDASILSQAGIPSVVFGPGDIAQAHTDDEWISIQSLNRATDLLLKFFSSLS